MNRNNYFRIVFGNPFLKRNIVEHFAAIVSACRGHRRWVYYRLGGEKVQVSERQKGQLKRYIAAGTYQNRAYPVKYRGIL